MNWYRSIHSAGVKNAGNVVRLSDFHPADALIGPVRAATSPAQLLPFPLSRRLTHAASLPPETAHAWRNLLARSTAFHSDATAKVRAGASPHVGSAAGSAPGRRFFSEAEAALLALGPRLPHHRRPMTADEALAGIITALVCGAAVIYLIARSL